MNRNGDTGKPMKVFWSDAEREVIVSKAVDLQRENPELSGLSLVRQAMYALPVDRRRKLISLSQVPWFEPGIQKESRRRSDLAALVTAKLVEHDGDPYLPVLRTTARSTLRALKVDRSRAATLVALDNDTKANGDTLVLINSQVNRAVALLEELVLILRQLVAE